MNDFNDIKNVWQNQTSTAMPGAEAIKTAANKSRRQMVIKNALGLVMLGGTVAFIAYIGLAADFKFITTRLGIVITIIAIIGAMVINSQMLLLLLNKTDSTTNNQAYLQQLISYRNKQRMFQTYGMALYYSLLTLGLALYLYEFYARDHAFGLKAYGLTMLWIAFAWFYIRPRTIKKQSQKIDGLINQIESIAGQLDE